MDENDFKIPSPKRQRTNSPEAEKVAPASPSQNVSIAKSGIPGLNATKQSTAQETLPAGENSMLDTLMQHVESESNPEPTLIPHSQPAPSHNTSSAPNVTKTDVTNESSEINVAESAYKEDGDVSKVSNDTTTETAHVADKDITMGDLVNDVNIADQSRSLVATTSSEATDQSISVNGTQEPAVGVDTSRSGQDAVSEMAQAAAAIEGIPPMLDNEQVVDSAEGAEWEVDSSPYESSSDSDSSDDSSDDDSDDEDADGDYAMLDPEEQARILMQGDGGSDDEGDRSKTKGEGAGLKTANEKAEDVLPIPDISITEDMKVEELGEVEGIVDKIVLIKAKVSGEYQVLDSGSLLCLEDRKIAGVVAELLGRVEQPMYMVRFRTVQEIEERGLSEKGTRVFYVPSHSTFVFTQPLKAVKGSDASNFHDEEVGDDEMEFSDDEAEALHKRNLKLKRQGKQTETGRGRGSGRGNRGGQRGARSDFEQLQDQHGAAYGNGSLEMNYDDDGDKDGEEGYTPLARPSNLQDMMGSAQSPEMSGPTMLPPFTSQDRGRGRGGRGGRDRGRGGRGRGQHRGTPNGQNRQSQNRSQFQGPSQASTTDYQHPVFPFPPPPPMLTPQSHGYPGSLVTSPMSPLPNQQFNFGMGFQGSQNYGGNNYQHQQQQQQQSYQPPIPGFNQPQQNTYFNPAGMQQYNAQPPQQNGGFQNGWQNNQAAIAEVQRQLEQMRRNANGSHQ